MPELPEVEIVVKEIKNWIKEENISNYLIEKIEFVNKNYKTNNQFSSIIGKKIENVERKGKWIFFNFKDENFVLACHLRMTGKFFFKETKGACIILVFSNNKKLFFLDPRKFAIFKIIEIENIEKMKIGCDAIGEIDEKKIFKIFQKNKRNIKTVLLDQKIISGIGNIYVSEILFNCKINPLKKTNEITEEEAKNIILNTKIILNRSIKMGGTSIIDFISPLGIKGKFQEELKVYMRSKKSCYECEFEIKKIIINGRSTYFCSNCQK